MALHSPLRYAFDLGTNSIGWAVYGLDRAPSDKGPPATIVGLVACGTRLFDDSRNPKDGRSLAEMRRVPRAARKRRDRFLMRRATLINLLMARGLLPADRATRLALAGLDPYRLRAEALDRRLEPHEVGRALMHINQRRGFQSNRRADRKDKTDDKGKIASGVARLEVALRAEGARTFGQYLWRRHCGPEGDAAVRKRDGVRIRMEGENTKALYDFYPSRAMLLAEFDAVMATQAAHHPAILTPDTIAELRDTIFHQRPLKPVEVGRCTFVPQERRLPRALPSVEQRVIYEMLNALRYGRGLKLDQRLTLEQRNALAAMLTRGEAPTMTKLRKFLGIGENVRISLEEGGKEELKDFAARSAILAFRKSKGRERQELFGERWFALSLAQRDKIVQRLVDTDDEQTIIDWLSTDYGLTEDAARAVAAWTPCDGVSRLGRTANTKILEALKTPSQPVYADAVKAVGWHHSDERDGIIELPLPYYGRVLERHVLFGTGDRSHDDEKRYGRLPNPTAHVALNQLRRVVNLLVDAYGKPAQIIIELARDLKLNKEQKDEARKKQAENTKTRDRYRGILAENHQQETPDNFLRLRLFEEQERAGGGVARCPFSLESIRIQDLFSPAIEIEHLLPYSRTFDDSAANKVVCFRSMNRIKRSKSPHEAFQGEARWEDISAAALRLPVNKRWRFAENAMERFEGTERDFLARQIGETRYLSRMAKVYLSRACDPDQVYVTTGQLTAMLRGRLGLNALFSNRQEGEAGEGIDSGEPKRKKTRDDHRHHAIDACVIGAIDRSLLQRMAALAARAETENRERVVREAVPDGWPFPKFRDVVREKVGQIVVSIKPEHGKGAALHEDTAYGFVKNEAEAKEIGNLVRRKPLVDLSPNEIDAIRDPYLRRQVQAAVAPLRNENGKLAAGQEKAFKAALTVFARESAAGRTRGVRRVRHGKNEKNVVAIRDRRTGATYKALIPGENHHIDIVQMRDGKWKGFPATCFDVNQKGWRPKWEVEKRGGKLVMRLHKGDTIELDDKDNPQRRRVMVVHRLKAENGQLFLAEHFEGGELDKRHDGKGGCEGDPFRWDMASISRLKLRRAAKVDVDAIGRVKKTRSNVEL